MRANSTLNNMAHEVILLEREYSRAKKSKEKADLIFKIDFRYENRFINKDSNREPPKIESVELQKDSPEKLGNSFKKLRNELAKAVHPDKHDGSAEMQEEFKQIQEAFEDGNITKLIETASRYDVDVQLDDTDLEKVAKVMSDQRNYIKSVRSSISWAWMKCGRLNSDRAEAWKALGINKIDFKNWFYAQGGDLNQLEKECHGRKISEGDDDEQDLRPPRPRKNTKISGFLTCN